MPSAAAPPVSQVEHDLHIAFSWEDQHLATAVQNGPFLLQGSESEQTWEFGPSASNDRSRELVHMGATLGVRHCDGACDLPLALLVTVADSLDVQRSGHPVLSWLVTARHGPLRQLTSQVFSHEVSPSSRIDDH